MCTDKKYVIERLLPQYMFLKLPIQMQYRLLSETMKMIPGTPCSLHNNEISMFVYFTV